MKKQLAITLMLAAAGVLITACQPDQKNLSNVNAANAANAANAPAPVPAITHAPLLTPEGLPDFATLVEQFGPAVVNITVNQTINPATDELSGDPFYDFFRRYGQSIPRSREGLGSGFIVSSDGFVLTNAHVVGDGNNTEVTVKLSDKREFTAKVVGSDTRTDVAVIKIDAKSLPTVLIGNPDEARVGQWVAAIGSPFGLDHSVTAGIISAKARRLPNENLVPFIQTDVAVNPGNSGGPLFDLSGRVIGINSQIYSRGGSYSGISFAIPIDVAMKVKDQLVKFGRVQRGRLGVAVQDVTPDLAASFGLNKPVGALISLVEPNSAAARAGLKSGDIVLKVDNTAITNSSDLSRAISEYSPKNKVTLEVWRDHKARNLSAVLDDFALATETNPGSRSKTPALASSGLGLSMRPLTPAEAGQLGVSGGLLVEGATGKAAKSGIAPGDVVLAVNETPVTSLSQFTQLLARSGNNVAFLIQRGPVRIFLSLKK